jgi:hypothetical protein
MCVVFRKKKNNSGLSGLAYMDTCKTRLIGARYFQTEEVTKIHTEGSHVCVHAAISPELVASDRAQLAFNHRTDA